MERASGAVLGEGGSEVDLRGLFTLNKKIASSVVILSANEGPVCSHPAGLFPDANWLIAGLARIPKRPHGGTGHRYRARNCIGPSLRSG